MRRLLTAVLSCCLAAAAPAAEMPAPAPADTLRLHNIASAFSSFYDANKDKPEAEQVAAFKREVASSFPAFYGVERYGSGRTQADQDAHIAATIRAFPSIRDDYLRKARQFDAELPRYIAGFKAWFPDYRPTVDIYVLHSLGEMDGGTRTFEGRNYLIFGIDGMVRYHGKGRETAFFDHELFHTYHDQAMGGCNGNNEPVWALLWQEGLATYVSRAMNPDATEHELLLDFPGNMAADTRAVLPAAFAHLQTVLESRDGALAGELFSTGEKGKTHRLPVRRGYYLGYLVAQDAARTRSVQDLARLDCRQAQALVRTTVAALVKENPR